MELWIRSQDTQKLLPNPILIVDDNKILTLKNDYRDTHLLLGHYKSKERALEVLDAIHQRLIYIQCIELAGIEYINNQMKRTGVDCVYEMPEE